MQTRKVALVTGASRGIGEATAHELAARGYALVLAARSVEPLQHVAADLIRAGASALAVPTDMSRMAEVERLARIALAQFGRVDVVVQNAGVGGSGKTLLDLEDAQVDALLDTNLTAPILLTRLLLPQMIERGSGSIIFIASVAGSIGLPTSTIYSASKFGLRGFALGLRREVGHKGVGVSIISPGFIETAMTEHLRTIPMAQPELVARAIANAIKRPRREQFVPGYYRLLVSLERSAPWLLDGALRLYLQSISSKEKLH
jgi:short-subunit dehydrogenase